MLASKSKLRTNKNDDSKKFSGGKMNICIIADGILSSVRHSQFFCNWNNKCVLMNLLDTKTLLLPHSLGSFRVTTE